MNARARVLTCASLAGCWLAAGCSAHPRQAAQDLLREAATYSQRGKYAAATIEIERALQLEPKSVAAYQALAQVEMRQQKWPEAYAALHEALNIDPGQAEARLEVAQLLLATRDYKGATAAAQRVLAAQPANAAAHQVLAAADAATSHPRQALRQFQAITQLTPQDANAWINLALAETGLQQPDLAAADLRRAIAVDPHAVLGYANLAQLELMQRQPADAQHTLEQGLAANPNSKRLWLAQAQLDYDPAHPQGADQDLDHLMRRRPAAAATALLAGEFYAAHGDSARAVAIEQAAAAAFPQDVGLHEHLLQHYLAAEQWTQAAQADDALLRLQRDNRMARLGQAQLLLARHQPAQAADGLRKLVLAYPDWGDAHYDLALADSQTGNTTEALHEAQRALEQQPHAANCLGLLARLWLAQNDPQQAQHYAMQYLQSGGDPGQGNRMLGEAALQGGDANGALAAFSKAKLEASGNAQDHVLLAEAAAASQPALAGREFHRAVALAPQSSEILGQCVHWDVQQRQWDAAQGEIASFAAAHPGDANGPWLMATLDMARQRYQPAQQELHQALALQPGFLQAELDLGRIAQSTGDSAQALAWYQQALRAQPHFAPLLALVGNLYLQQRRWAQAAGYFQQALRAQPGFALAAANLAWVDAQQNQDLATALTLAQQADRALPDLPSVNDTLGWVYFKMGSYPAAVPLLRHCVQAEPVNAVYHFHLGMALRAAGQGAAGAEQLRRALALHLPDSEAGQARRALER